VVAVLYPVELRRVWLRCLHLLFPELGLLFGPPELRLQGDQLFYETVEFVAIRGLVFAAVEPLDALKMAGVFELRDGPLDGTAALADAAPDGFLGDPRRLVGIPPRSMICSRTLSCRGVSFSLA
jgi:hypothetical protein